MPHDSVKAGFLRIACKDGMKWEYTGLSEYLLEITVSRYPKLDCGRSG
jgi:hypothetical protein